MQSGRRVRWTLELKTRNPLGETGRLEARQSMPDNDFRRPHFPPRLSILLVTATVWNSSSSGGHASHIAFALPGVEEEKSGGCSVINAERRSAVDADKKRVPDWPDAPGAAKTRV